jgi:hypothetical protein
MIEINTYIRDAEGELVEISEYTEPPPDSNYIDGALELAVDGTVIIDRSMHDYIDELWAYVSNMVEHLARQGHASTYFPDQPIELSFARQGASRVLVKLSAPGFPERNIRGRIIPASPEIKRVATADQKELIEGLREHGTKFFHKMHSLLPEGPNYEDALKRLNSGRLALNEFRLGRSVSR